MKRALFVILFVSPLTYACTDVSPWFMDTPPDLAAPADLAELRDLAAAPADTAGPPDMTASTPADLAELRERPAPPDLAELPDLAAAPADLSEPRDLTPPAPDIAGGCYCVWFDCGQPGGCCRCSQGQSCTCPQGCKPNLPKPGTDCR